MNTSVCRDREKGFTLVELMVTLTISAIVMAGVFGVYRTFTRHVISQDLLIEAQQNGRAAVDIIQKDLVLIGHRVPSTVKALEVADDGSILFRYVDKDESGVDTGYEIEYGTTLVSGVTYLYKTVCEKNVNFDNTCQNANPTDKNKVVGYLKPSGALDFDYYDGEGAALTTLPLDDTDRGNTRFVRVSIYTQTRKALPNQDPPVYKQFAVRTEARLRNVGIMSSSSDTTAPVQPTGLQVREVQLGGRSGLCGMLQLKWDMGAEGDLSGYKIFYTLGVSTKHVTVSLADLIVDGTSYKYTLAPSGDDALDSSLSDGTSTATYTIGIRARDDSGNVGVLSDEVTGNPSPSNYTLDAGDDDTTINPSKPAAVTGFQSQDGGIDGQVALSWSYDTANNPDVLGFRIFRNTTSFTSYPVTSGGTVTWEAGIDGDGKAILSAADTSYTDSDADLVGCQVYYYAIAPVSCDTTLITEDDAAEDGNNTKYIASDYAGVCGDGSGPCTPGTGMAAVSGQDSAPPDTTNPAAPGNIGVRAGWRRVAVSFTQPADDDIEQTCIYTEMGGSYPLINTDPLLKGAYGCYNATSGKLVPDSNGAFDISEVAKGASSTFWHDDWNAETPANPSLTDNQTYSYRAVAFDRCGRASTAADAQATTTLCGEDPPVCVAPDTPASADCVNAADTEPPAVTDLTADCCNASSGVSLSWTEVSSDAALPSSYDNPWDLAGYRIFRSTNDADWSGATLLNPAAPWWPSSYEDLSAADGNSYYYRVVSTDCPYERTNPTDATIRTDMINGDLKFASIGPVSPGSVLRDEKCVAPDNCSQDDHRAVLTGVDIDTSDGSGEGWSEPVSTYTHDSVTMFFENTSAGTQTIQEITVDWTNSSAFLRTVTVGGGRSGEQALTWNISQASSNVTADSPYTRTVAAYPLAAPKPEIDGLARYVPISFEFKDGSDNAIDMRDDTIRITLSSINDSTGKVGCISYLTTEEAYEGIFVPVGPSITAVQQDQPISPTFGYAVPGATGSNTVPSGAEGPIVVSARTDVNVSADVPSLTTDAQTGSKVGMSEVTLHYEVTFDTVTSSPDLPYATDVAMTNSGGNTWTATIPPQDGSRVWYAISAVDEDGNYDISPEKANDEGAYTYDQKVFDVCDFTPKEPTDLAGTLTPTTVALSWTAPTEYAENDGAIDVSDTIKYRVYRADSLGGAFVKLTAGACADPVAGTSCTDTVPDTSAADYVYYVTAINSCATPNEGDASIKFVECTGSAAAEVIPSASSIIPGESFEVTVAICSKANDFISGESLPGDLAVYGTEFQPWPTAGYVFRDIGWVDLVEDGDSGVFHIDGASYGGQDYIATANGSRPAPTTVGRNLADTDFVLVYYFDGVAYYDNIVVNADPCEAAPSAPASLSGSVSGQDMTIEWPQVAEWDRFGYKVWEKAVCDHASCGGIGTLIEDWFVRDTVYDTATDPLSQTYAADKGTIAKVVYSFKITTIDTCGTPNESVDSAVWAE